MCKTIDTLLGNHLRLLRVVNCVSTRLLYATYCYSKKIQIPVFPVNSEQIVHPVCTYQSVHGECIKDNVGGTCSTHVSEDKCIEKFCCRET